MFCPRGDHPKSVPWHVRLNFPTDFIQLSTPENISNQTYVVLFARGGSFLRTPVRSLIPSDGVCANSDCRKSQISVRNFWRESSLKHSELGHSDMTCGRGYIHRTYFFKLTYGPLFVRSINENVIFLFFFLFFTRVARCTQKPSFEWDIIRRPRRMTECHRRTARSGLCRPSVLRFRLAWPITISFV